MKTASETGTTLTGDADLKRRSAHMTLDGAAPGTTAHVLEVTAPRAGQWMVLPPVDAPAVIVSGVGEGARAAAGARRVARVFGFSVFLVTGYTADARAVCIAGIDAQCARARRMPRSDAHARPAAAP